MQKHGQKWTKWANIIVQIKSLDYRTDEVSMVMGVDQSFAFLPLSIILLQWVIRMKNHGGTLFAQIAH